MATSLFVVASAFWPTAPVVLTVDIVVGIAVLTDLVAGSGSRNTALTTTGYGDVTLPGPRGASSRSSS